MDLKIERSRLLSLFKKRFGGGVIPRVALAPGRTNLIGEHTDYNGGFVLPIAVSRHTAVVFRPSAEPRIRVYSETVNDTDEFSPTEMPRLTQAHKHWANYIRGTAWALARRGLRLKGADLFVTSDLPRGAGLSSSASLEVGVGLALLTLGAHKLDRQNLALACQEAEHKYAGVHCGIMDQMVVARALPEHALLLDCESLKVRNVPIALLGYSFATFDTGVRHKLASSEYNKRRAECERAAKVLKRSSLRHVTNEDLLKHGHKLSTDEQKRVRHVLTENLRVVQFADALMQGEVEEMGRLLNLSHMSLAADYQVSCRELDMVVTELGLQNTRDGACPGARMVGGGFGGAVVALLKTSALPKYQRALKPFAKGGSLRITPAGGAEVHDL